ncbi:hypothetical protein HNP84_004139 [Thermocatellispora tengchongensis]|uniref:Uncharacterized protein n=1 Tax=Thermocatellispora tengchongensis TaxID=1073253 RepID=A0A840PB49_9ACTN|nr:hypothetical protein [Thermocatellispora tengchongensis]MBB5134407.1 hypothetical protein [Thermocatellispora tengchongensis]
MSTERTPEPNELRFTDDDEIEIFDGQKWVRYERLPSEGYGTHRGEE